MPTALDISIAETLALLDGDFAEFAEGVASDQYAVWLGAGISLGKLPGLEGVAGAVLEYLRTKIDPADPNCRFRESLNRVLGLVVFSADEWKEIDYAKPATVWKDYGRICKGLTGVYGRMLDQHPPGEKPDYLVWDAVRVVERYGDPSITPGAEHLGLAALIVEGVASDTVSANWDPLVERALELLLRTTAGVLQVRVLPDDVKDNTARARLYKFHGCAVLAGKDEAKYRERIVGRQSQINGWADKAENKVIAGKLHDLAISKSTLMLGLSTQDTNIQTVFVVAQQNLPASFPTHPPAVVLSENIVGADQLGLLQNFYKADYAAKTQEIKRSALLPAYGQSLLPALWLHIVCAKLEAFFDRSTAGLSGADKAKLRSALRRLRDGVAGGATPKQHEEFMKTALAGVGRAVGLFREGRTLADGAGCYSPLSIASIPKSLADPTVASSGITELALGIALMALGEAEGYWQCKLSDPTGPNAGAMRVVGAVRSADVFFASNNQAASRLLAGGFAAADDDAIIVHSHEIPAQAARHPTAPPGRTLRKMRREISLAGVADSPANLDTLLKSFRSGVAV